jgi:hypothetical protein
LRVENGKIREYHAAMAAGMPPGDQAWRFAYAKRHKQKRHDCRRCAALRGAQRQAQSAKRFGQAALGIDAEILFAERKKIGADSPVFAQQKSAPVLMRDVLCIFLTPRRASGCF